MKSNGRRLSSSEIDFIKNNVDKSVDYISNALNCSKSTASRWLRNFRGYQYPDVREKTRDAAKQLWDRKKKQAEQLASDIFSQNCTNSYFLTGLAIYWAEGTKNRLQFTNADPNMICFFIKWLTIFIPLTKISYEIRGKSDDLEHTIVEFWSDYIPLLEYKFYRINMRITTGLVVVSIRTEFVQKYFIRKLLDLYIANYIKNFNS